MAQNKSTMEGQAFFFFFFFWSVKDKLSICIERAYINIPANLLGGKNLTNWPLQTQHK